MTLAKTKSSPYLTNWVSRSRSDAEQHVADHQFGGGTTLVGRVEDEVAVTSRGVVCEDGTA